MAVLLALFLVVGLPRVETNVTVTGRQQAHSCYVCEQENDFECKSTRNCPADARFCTTAAVRIFPRFFYVSKQCAKICPVYEPSSARARPFVLEKPMPFIYVSCCKGALCNVDAPDVEDYRVTLRARQVQRSRAGPLLQVLLLVMLGRGLA